MAHIASGSFWGYRELAPAPSGRVYFWSFAPPDPEIRLQYWHWDLLGPVPFSYEVHRGLATDAYPAEFTMFSLPYNYQSRLILCTIRDNPAQLIFTYDGVTEQPARRFDIGFARLEAARGFKIRNVTPGLVSRYQVIPML